MKKLILLGLIVAVWVTLNTPNVASSLDYNTTCTGGQLIRNATVFVNTNTGIELFQNTTCAYGCLENGLACDDIVAKTDINYLPMVFVFLAIAGLFVVLGIKTEAGYLQLLFLGMAMVYILAVGGMMTVFPTLLISEFQSISVSLYQALMAVFIMFWVIILVSMMYNMITQKKHKVL